VPGDVADAFARFANVGEADHTQISPRRPLIGSGPFRFAVESSEPGFDRDWIEQRLENQIETEPRAR
jgi:hypothetical protein